MLRGCAGKPARSNAHVMPGARTKLWPERSRREPCAEWRADLWRRGAPHDAPVMPLV